MAMLAAKVVAPVRFLHYIFRRYWSWLARFIHAVVHFDSVYDYHFCPFDRAPNHLLERKWRATVIG